MKVEFKIIHLNKTNLPRINKEGLHLFTGIDFSINTHNGAMFGTIVADGHIENDEEAQSFLYNYFTDLIKGNYTW